MNLILNDDFDRLGWVLTHGGYNTINEALIKGLPLIAWPFAADQPGNAAWINFTSKVGFELLQIREKLIGKKLYNYPGLEITGTQEDVRHEMREVLKKCKGKEGAIARENARRLGGALKTDALENGDSYLAKIFEL